MLKFVNQMVSDIYESDFAKDPVVHVPAGSIPNSGFKGKLSTILPEHAEMLIFQGSNLVRKKAVTKQSAPVPVKSETKDTSIVK